MATYSDSYVSPHFSKKEMRWDATPAEYRPNLELLAGLLETTRAIVGVPLLVTSTWRAATYNETLPGASKTSQHLTGEAADFKPIGITVAEFMRRIGGSALLSKFGQLILYPLGTNHVHMSLPTRGVVGTILLQVSPDASKPVYRPYTSLAFAALAGEAAKKQAVTLAVGGGLAGAALLASNQG